MHEMSLCESLIQVVEEQAKAQNYSNVKTVYLEVGAFSGVEKDAMCFCFDVVCRGTIADSAKLEITELPATAWCFDCSKEIAISSRLDSCPDCHGYSIQAKGGDEMRIKELEVY
ncbi:putative hydrogenase nickel incorporation protein HypA 2 [Vibrio sp. MACH09]|uniref:hydrogenase maturation nickel metallochaperone HypA n=1 Tax=unclassified Vibrio TaxID=2614977 RepID=UPI00149366AA|nr:MULTISPECIES: hydrogenase maturation nickel metallochaperone HypA [unclassified Vibrio]NOI68677.1 hydrogenase maturation nickel metallochaperone HypA [Vibrio sp. 99-8-1]GLO62254.1 putative hydrogenase nickel incorporation protein HypA 2 [Vibrio sp. MACH09]